MGTASREFQVFAKPAGAACNLDCRYCYYLSKKDLYADGDMPRMSEEILESYIAQHISAYPGPVINFSWHGGEPTLLGLDYFRKIVSLQKKHQPAGRRITNGMQTNGTLIDDAWGRFLAQAGFSVGISLDGPKHLHDRYRVTRGGKPTHDKAMQGYRLLNRHGVSHDILCVVNAENVKHPMEVYRFFKEIKARHIGFLPLVAPQPDRPHGVSDLSVLPEAFGQFLITVFDGWVEKDIGKIKIQIFEEAARTAFGQDHSLCIFRKTCGDVPVMEKNGDVYSCDHFVDSAHLLGNIRETALSDLLESPAQQAFGRAKWDDLPGYCRSCEVHDMCYGGCPKNRFCRTPDGEPGLNHLCAGYRRFFNHVLPFISEIAAMWRHQQVREMDPIPPHASGAKKSGKTGRNDPCPCGSGRKYKKCCLNSP